MDNLQPTPNAGSYEVIQWVVGYFVRGRSLLGRLGLACDEGKIRRWCTAKVLCSRWIVLAPQSDTTGKTAALIVPNVLVLAIEEGPAAAGAADPPGGEAKAPPVPTTVVVAAIPEAHLEEFLRRLPLSAASLTRDVAR